MHGSKYKFNYIILQIPFYYSNKLKNYESKTIFRMEKYKMVY
jgi:hypothetical protein